MVVGAIKEDEDFVGEFDAFVVVLVGGGFEFRGGLDQRFGLGVLLSHVAPEYAR